jgi:hypothetical protein
LTASSNGRERFRPDLRIFGVAEKDPGFIYLLEHAGRLKIGKTVNVADRLRAAKTWLPDCTVVGAKPFWNVSAIERDLHAGFSRGWYSGEWFSLDDELDKVLLIEGFAEFSDTDRDMNSVDFIYWFNSSGLAEFVIELNSQNLTLPKFLHQESEVKKK